MTKYCPSCNAVKNIEDFQKNRGRSDGLQGYCKPCRKTIDAANWLINKERRARRKQELRQEIAAEIRAHKSVTPCSDCGGIFHYAAMQFDHRPGEVKLANVADISTRGMRKRVWAEIDKCDVVCANCHAVRTHNRINGM